jgi:UPF0716 protein FxsA
MFSWIVILALSALSLLDLFILLQLSKGIGVLVIVVSQVLTGLLGWLKIRKMDFGLFFYLDTELKKKTRIIRELWEESLILMGALLLIAPGYLTDLIGIAFILPTLRNLCLEIFEEI